MEFQVPIPEKRCKPHILMLAIMSLVVFTLTTVLYTFQTFPYTDWIPFILNKSCALGAYIFLLLYVVRLHKSPKNHVFAGLIFLLIAILNFFILLFQIRTAFHYDGMFHVSYIDFLLSEPIALCDYLVQGIASLFVVVLFTIGAIRLWKRKTVRVLTAIGTGVMLLLPLIQNIVLLILLGNTPALNLLQPLIFPSPFSITLLFLFVLDKKVPPFR